MTQRAPDPGQDGNFVHLYVHSEFSLLDGLSRIGEMTQRVAEQGMTAMALTDHGAMYGVIPFYAAARKAGIKPIIGQPSHTKASLRSVRSAHPLVLPPRSAARDRHKGAAHPLARLRAAARMPA